MFKNIFKLFILPAFVILTPLLVGLYSVKQSSFDANSIKRALSGSNLYESIISTIKSSSEGEENPFANNSFLTPEYIQGKVELVVDQTEAWATGKSEKEPEISFLDIKDKLVSQTDINVEEVSAYLEQFKDQIKEEGGEDSVESMPDFSKLIKDTPTIKLGNYLFWVKSLVWIQKYGLTVAIAVSAVLFALVILLSLGKGISGILFWTGLTSLYGALGLFLITTFAGDPTKISFFLAKFLPKQFSDIATLVIQAITFKPFVLYQQTSNSIFELLVLLGIVLVVISFADFKPSPATLKRNAIVVAVALVLFTSAYLFVSPNASKLPVFGRFAKNKSGVVAVSSFGKSAKVGLKGGNIQVSDSTNTYELSVGKNSIVWGAEIKAAPIYGVSGLPKEANFIGGVDFKAPDAVLSKTAVLTINLNQEPKGKLLAFAYENGGENMIYFPASAEGNTVRVPVMHFSGFGLITVPDTFKEKEINNNVRVQAQQDILSILSWIQTLQGFGMNDTFTEVQKNGFSDILSNWWKEGVKPYLDSAQTKDEDIVPAAKEYLIWLQAVQSLDLDDKQGGNIKMGRELLAKAIKSASERSHKACVQEKDPSQASILLRYYALAESLGLDGVSGLDVDHIKDMSLKCAYFKIEISSHFIGQSSICPGFDEEYSGTIELTPDEDFTLSGKGDVTPKQLMVCNTPCRLAKGDGPVTTTVEVPTTPFLTTKGASEVIVRMDVADETYNQYDCSYIIPGTDTEFGLHVPLGWYGEMFNMHDDEAIDLVSMIISDWKITASKDAYAIKEYKRVKTPSFMGIKGVPTSEDTTLKLIHSPKN